MNTLEDELEREKYSVQIYKEKYEYYHTKSESLGEVKQQLETMIVDLTT